MPLLAPAFREFNHHRLTKAKRDGLSCQTISDIVFETTGERIPGQAFEGYFQVQEIASKKAVIRKATFDLLPQPN